MQEAFTIQLELQTRFPSVSVPSSFRPESHSPVVCVRGLRIPRTYRTDGQQPPPPPSQWDRVWGCEPHPAVNFSSTTRRLRSTLRPALITERDSVETGRHEQPQMWHAQRYYFQFRISIPMYQSFSFWVLSLLMLWYSLCWMSGAGGLYIDRVNMWRSYNPTPLLVFFRRSLYIYTGWPKKTKLSFFVHIFAKYWPILQFFYQ